MSRAWKNKPANWARIRLMVLARDQYQCQMVMPGICTGKATHVDHIVSRANGGSEALSNLRAACATCNQFVGDGSRIDPDPRRPNTSW